MQMNGVEVPEEEMQAAQRQAAQQRDEQLAARAQ